MKCCKYSAGDMRDVCLFERETQTSDDAGGWHAAWHPITGAPTKCRLDDMSGGERWQAMRVDATVTARVVCRAFDGLTAKDRVLVNGQAYNIRFVRKVGRSPAWLEIDVEGGVAT